MIFNDYLTCAGYLFTGLDDLLGVLLLAIFSTVQFDTPTATLQLCGYSSASNTVQNALGQSSDEDSQEDILLINVWTSKRFDSMLICKIQWQRCRQNEMASIMLSVSAMMKSVASVFKR